MSEMKTFNILSIFDTAISTKSMVVASHIYIGLYQKVCIKHGGIIPPHQRSTDRKPCSLKRATAGNRMRDHIFVDPTNDHVMTLKICSASLRGGADDKSRVGKIEDSAISLKCEKT